MLRPGLVTLLLAAGLGVASPPAPAAEPVTYPEIVESIRALAADHLGVRTGDVNTVDSLFSQGMNEKTFDALVVAVQQEFGVVLPDEVVREGKWNDNTRAMSVRRLADMVERQLRPR